MLAFLLLLTAPHTFAQNPTPQTLKFYSSPNCSGTPTQTSEYSLYSLTVTPPPNTASLQLYGFWRFESSSSPLKTYRISYTWECFPSSPYDTFIPFGDKYMNQEALYLYSLPDFQGDVRILQNDDPEVTSDPWPVASAFFSGSSEWAMYKDKHFQDFYECWQPKYNHKNYVTGTGFTVLPIHPQDMLKIKSVHKKCLKPSLHLHMTNSAQIKYPRTLSILAILPFVLMKLY